MVGSYVAFIKSSKIYIPALFSPESGLHSPDYINHRWSQIDLAALRYLYNSLIMFLISVDFSEV